ncbi:uncharacterized protein [Dysidea avara]|uniref:uncharacterized protein isoform X3 n=1 Tax=Dysidea avara TaxID=196820 RepID=UPI00331B0EBE
MMQILRNKEVCHMASVTEFHMKCLTLKMEYHFLFILLLLLITLHDSEQQGLVITNPPLDNVVCVGDEVNITCGYNFSVQIFPVWIIGGQPFSGSNIENSSMFESPIVGDTFDTVLTVHSADEMMNQTSFKCEFQFLPPITSSDGLLTVMGVPMASIIKVLERRLTSLVISWDTFSHTSCGDVTYNVTLSDGTAELVEERTTTSNTISYTDLDNDTQYEVTVLAINNAGPGTVVTTNVTTLTPSAPSPPRDLTVYIKFVNYKPVVKITWNVSPLSPNMPEVEGFTVSMTGEDGRPNIYKVGPDVTTFTSDNDVSTHLSVGVYTISVCSENSVGHSEAVSAPLTVRWLKSASVQLLQDNESISVMCNVTESTPLVKCLSRLNCSKCDGVTSKVFSGHIEIPVLADNDYHISIQVVREDTGVTLEDYSEVKTFSVPKPTSDPSSTMPTASSSDEDNPKHHIAVLSAIVLLLIVLLVAMMFCLCISRKRRNLLSLEPDKKIACSNGHIHSDGSLTTSTNGSIKDHNDTPGYSEVADFKTPKRKSTSSAEIPAYSEVVEFKKPKKASCFLEGEKSPITRSSSESSEPQKKYNKSNYVELEGFDDKILTVMPVPVPEVTYSDVKVDLSKQENS